MSEPATASWIRRRSAAGNSPSTAAAIAGIIRSPSGTSRPLVAQRPQHRGEVGHLDADRGGEHVVGEVEPQREHPRGRHHRAVQHGESSLHPGHQRGDRGARRRRGERGGHGGQAGRGLEDGRGGLRRHRRARRGGDEPRHAVAVERAEQLDPAGGDDLVELGEFGTVDRRPAGDHHRYAVARGVRQLPERRRVEPMGVVHDDQTAVGPGGRQARAPGTGEPPHGSGRRRGEPAQPVGAPGSVHADDGGHGQPPPIPDRTRRRPSRARVGGRGRSLAVLYRRAVYPPVRGETVDEQVKQARGRSVRCRETPMAPPQATPTVRSPRLDLGLARGNPRRRLLVGSKGRLGVVFGGHDGLLEDGYEARKVSDVTAVARPSSARPPIRGE